MTIEDQVNTLQASVTALLDAISIKRTTLEESVTTAVAARDSVLAHPASMMTYATTAAGIAATTAGQFFMVPAAPYGITIYENVAGVATARGSLLTQALHSDGSVGAPSITFASDSNTGLYRSTADTLSFATGGIMRAILNSTGLTLPDTSRVNWGTTYITGSDATDALRIFTSNTERLSITSAGNVGLGIPAPANKLDVAGAILAQGNASSVALYTSAGHAIRQNGAAGGALYFDTGAGGATHGSFIWRSASTLTERMRLDTAGNLGLGTAAPAQKLDVNGNAIVRGTLEATGALTARGDTLISAATTETRKLDVGAGRTGNGISRLNLVGDATQADGMALIRNGGVNGESELRHRGTGALKLRAAEAGAVTIETTATERLRVTPTGEVGIGTLTPAAMLDVVGKIRQSGSGASYVETDGDTNGSVLKLNRGGVAGQDAFLRQITGDLRLENLDSGAISFRTAGDVERLRLDANGDVTIAGGHYYPGFIYSAPVLLNTLTSADITGIPADAWEIDVVLDDVSLNAADHILLQVAGADGTFISAGYISAAQKAVSTAVTTATASNGLIVMSGVAANTVQGRVKLRKTGNSNRWMAEHLVFHGTTALGWGVGSIDTPTGVISAVRLLRSATGAFDLGNFCVGYKR